MIRRPPRSTLSSSSAASDVYKRQVWENVPGVLSSNRGRDFATFLTAMGKIGYGFAYRVLDAQYLSLIHISEPTRQAEISYAVFCLKKKKQKTKKN